MTDAHAHCNIVSYPIILKKKKASWTSVIYMQNDYISMKESSLHGTDFRGSVIA